MSFNQAQIQAIFHRDGPMLVLAGPGSGKTTVITERTHHLIVQQGIDPSHILVITFTKAAATEMKERFLKRMNQQVYPVTFGTFHAVFFSILRHTYGYDGKNILREDEKMRILRELMQHSSMEYEDEKELLEELAGEIGLVKNSGKPLEEYFPRVCEKEIFAELYKGYEAGKRRARRIDFDDMLILCKELFVQRPDILKIWQEKFQYILVDEFQDINSLQFEIVQMLASPRNNLFVVGDDDQSIYRFRGARPDLMLDFPKVYPDAKQVLLNVNYRCQAQIVEGAKALISHNKVRFSKEIIPFRNSLEPPAFLEFQEEKEEYRYMIRELRELFARGISWNDMAILYRTNLQPLAFIEELIKEEIPFRTKENPGCLYDHWIARDILFYVSLALGDRRRETVLSVMNRPNRYLTRESLEEESVDFSSWKQYFLDRGRIGPAGAVERLSQDLTIIRKISPFAAIQFICKGMGYEEFLREYAAKRHVRTEESEQMLEALLSSAREFREFDLWLKYIEDYRRKFQEEQQSRKEEKREGVLLTTLHGSKGLEFSAVFLMDVNEGRMPYKKAVLPEEIEEERRMFYVGVTRAKDRLYLLTVKKRNGKAQEPSRFLKELQEDFSYISSNSSSSNNSSKRSSTISYSSSSSILEREGLPSASSR